MDHTEEQKAQFKRQFAERRKRQIILAIPLVLLLCLASFNNKRKGEALPGIPADIVAPVFFVAVVGALAFSWHNWRCPACNTYLGRGIGPRFCRKCGVALQ